MRLILSVKRRQMLLATGIGVTLFIGTAIVFYLLGQDSEMSPSLGDKEPQKISIETATGKLDPHDIWRFKLEAALEENKKKVDLLEKMLRERGLDAAPDSKGLENSGGIEELRQEIATLREQMDAQEKANALETPVQQDRGSTPWAHPNTGADGVGRVGSVGDGPQMAPAIIQKVLLTLREDKGRGLKKTTDNTIPAGAFVRATLLGGVDASTSIQASTDPRPVLLRIRDHGTLPRKLRSDLKNCHVLASSYGDLSSERVYMRLEKLTCTEPKTHEISEVVVSGYVAGEDGKAGLRGVVVDKTGPLLRHSFVGGFLGGMSKFLTNTQQHYTYPLGNTSPFAQANPLTSEQMLKSSLGSGASNALEKYADFYIKRAEQLQPVLQVAAGRTVDIVFTQSAELGETLFKSTIMKHNNQKRRQVVEHMPQEVWKQGG